MDATAALPRPARRWWSAAAFVLGCQLVGALGALATGTGTTDWYAQLAKPSFQPPSWVFGPVWTLLYTLMGLAAWRVWVRRDRSDASGHALLLFGSQLALNALWTPLFFGAHEIGLALVVLVGLAATILATILSFRRIDRAAAWLLLPYLLWVGFALALNAAIVRLN